MNVPGPAAERRPIPHASNLRDLGGYDAAYGASVKWRTLYRSNELSRLTDEAVDAFGAIGIRCICDLRSEDEQSHAPTRLPAVNPPRVDSLPIRVSGNLRAMLGDGTSTGADMRRALSDTYRVFVRDHGDAFRALFDRLVDGPHYPLVFHCSAGKDRTGFAAAMILTALGVSQEAVREDYLLTNLYWDAGVPYASKMPEDIRDALLGAHPEYLDAAFDEIRVQHGSTEAYLANALHLTPERLGRLREHLLD